MQRDAPRPRASLFRVAGIVGYSGEPARPLSLTRVRPVVNPVSVSVVHRPVDCRMLDLRRSLTPTESMELHEQSRVVREGLRGLHEREAAGDTPSPSDDCSSAAAAGLEYPGCGGRGRGSAVTHVEARGEPQPRSRAQSVSDGVTLRPLRVSLSNVAHGAPASPARGLCQTAARGLAIAWDTVVRPRAATPAGASELLLRGVLVVRALDVHPHRALRSPAYRACSGRDAAPPTWNPPPRLAKLRKGHAHPTLVLIRVS
ncbi:hypothetical protein BV22DRAFT_1176231 [Leucogyrophana mollusca]|uniref:Uncharacterized protein n=1 Tax=Leucogyrophana mollusca TaxID=85980 RepID=A0ACB8BA14_9AGAM|nr:hypothetical protein BV22DRAFT_1176231 [Leucogyrophana mollusca]